ncbi:hypothetical protein ACFVWP_38360 [Streptomyces sp. NPDC058175]
MVPTRASALLLILPARRLRIDSLLNLAGALETRRAATACASALLLP